LGVLGCDRELYWAWVGLLAVNDSFGGFAEFFRVQVG
jgi:hypothetical protein